MFQKALVAFGVIGVIGLASVPVASAQTVNIQSASTAMTSTTTFSTANDTATCPAGTTLVGGGAELALAGAPVPNNGGVILGVNPTDASGNPVANGSADPASWTASGGYAGMAPGTDTATTFAMCSSDVTAATEVVVTATAAGSLGPVTAACPANTSLVGGGGGYTAFISGDNSKLFNSYPSDAAGDQPANNSLDLTAWTVAGNSNSATGAITTAVALCATDSAVGTQVVAANTTLSTVASGAQLPATVTCPSGTTLLDGGSIVTDNPSGPGTGGQGVHLIGDYPSDNAGNPLATGTPASWTVIAEDGGQTLTSMGTEAVGLCETQPPAMVPEAAYPALLLVGGAAVIGGVALLRRRRMAS